MNLLFVIQVLITAVAITLTVSITMYTAALLEPSHGTGEVEEGSLTVIGRASQRDDIKRRGEVLYAPLYKSGLEYRPVNYSSASGAGSMGKSKGKRRVMSRRRERCMAAPMTEECHAHHYIGTEEEDGDGGWGEVRHHLSKTSKFCIQGNTHLSDATYFQGPPTFALFVMSVYFLGSLGMGVPALLRWGWGTKLDDEPPAALKYWASLSAEERQAAAALGQQTPYTDP